MKLINDVYFYSTYEAAERHMNKLIAWGDATPEARVKHYSKGYTIKEKYAGPFWGEVAHNCPGGGAFIADGWVRPINPAYNF